MSRHSKQMELYEEFDNLPEMFREELTDVFFDLSSNEQSLLLKALLASDLGDAIVIDRLRLVVDVHEDQKLDLKETKDNYNGVF